MASLVNTYPRPSHSFIRREIRALERAGVTVERFAMRDDRSALSDPEDIAEHARTCHVLAQGVPAFAHALARVLMRAPGGLSAAGLLALRAGSAGACGGVPGTGGRLRHLVYLAEAAWLVERLRDAGVEHLHAHFGTNAATVAMLARAMGGPTFSFTAHGPEEFDAPRALALQEKCERAAFVVAISSFGRSQLMRWAAPHNWPRLKVVHCGLETDRFAQLAEMPDGQGRLVAIGRFAEQKGYLLLLEALAKARCDTPELHLTIVGDGPMRGAIEAAISRLGLAGAVTLAGWRDEAGVRAALDAAHALVLPSFAEGLPVVVMEAMAAARPVIATSIAGVPELAVDGETGWLVPAGDRDALATAMAAFAATPAVDLRRMGLAGRKRVLERHDIEVSAARLVGYFVAAKEAR